MPRMPPRQMHVSSSSSRPQHLENAPAQIAGPLARHAARLQLHLKIYITRQLRAICRLGAASAAAPEPTTVGDDFQDGRAHWKCSQIPLEWVRFQGIRPMAEARRLQTARPGASHLRAAFEVTVRRHTFSWRRNSSCLSCSSSTASCCHCRAISFAFSSAAYGTHVKYMRKCKYSMTQIMR